MSPVARAHEVEVARLAQRPAVAPVSACPARTMARWSGAPVERSQATTVSRWLVDAEGGRPARPARRFAPPPREAWRARGR